MHAEAQPDLVRPAATTAAAPRMVAAAVALAAAGPLVLAAWLEPAAAGLGTHEQLGLPACGWVAAAGIPCPSCGMTTAFAHAARGDLLGSFLVQPAGAILALAAAMVAVVAAFTAATGAKSWEVLWSSLSPRVWTVLIVVVILAWVYKIACVRLDAAIEVLPLGGAAW